ncbi:MAG: RNA polymerase sporulation sigma factor SigK [Clostridiales bacterium]|jgi:RNA polymerase sporulation-specific sigma factor|nr:RNA polymerase sporulation sigma factor SigK [Clostridiales bacterium]
MEVIYLFSTFLDLISYLYYFTLHISSPSSFPLPLTVKEEKECIEKMQNGDLEAKDKLIKHNLRLVAHIIKKYYSNYSEQEDLISVGTIGLIKGINSFDPSKGTRLATYTARCIENEILMYFRSRKKTSQDVYINDPIDIDGEGNPLTLMDIICIDDNIIDELDLKIKSEQLIEYVGNLTDVRERNIIILRYGLFDNVPMTQREIAGLLGISRSYVSRIEKKALQKLRKMFDSKP